MQFRFQKRFSFFSLPVAVTASLFLYACNNSAPKTGSRETETAVSKATLGTGDSLTKQTELSVLDGCVENLKAQGIPEAQAFARCKCFLERAKEKFGTVDSNAVAALQRDSAEMVNIAKRCK